MSSTVALSPRTVTGTFHSSVTSGSTYAAHTHTRPSPALTRATPLASVVSTPAVAPASVSRAAARLSKSAKVLVAPPAAGHANGIHLLLQHRPLRPKGRQAGVAGGRQLPLAGRQALELRNEGGRDPRLGLIGRLGQ